MKKTYLVVGATGQVGGKVVQALRARGEQVRVLIRSARQGDAFPGDVERVVGTLADFDGLRRAVDGVAGAFFVTPHDPDEERLGKSFVEACEAARVPRLVFSAARSTRTVTAGSPPAGRTW